METLLYLILAALICGFLAQRSERTVERTLRERRQPPASDLNLVEDFDLRPDRRSGTRFGAVRHSACHQPIIRVSDGVALDSLRAHLTRPGDKPRLPEGPTRSEGG